MTTETEDRPHTPLKILAPTSGLIEEKKKEDNTTTVSPAKWRETIVCTWTYQILYRLMVPPEKLQGYTNSMSPESQNADDRSHIEYQYCMSRRKNSCFHTTFSVGSTVDLQRHYF